MNFLILIYLIKYFENINEILNNQRIWDSNRTSIKNDILFDIKFYSKKFDIKYHLVTKYYMIGTNKVNKTIINFAQSIM